MAKHFTLWEKGLGRTREGFLEKLTRVFKGKGRENDSLWEDLERILIEGDMGVETTAQIIGDVRKSVSETGEGLEEKVRSLLKHSIRNLLWSETVKAEPSFKEKPYVILVVGVNGTGKTTTIGKLAHRFRKEGKKVLLAGSDTFRAAAGEQLEVWGKRAHADVIRQPEGADSASVAYDALDACIARHVDILIVDTAGRLHTKVNLMEELKKIRRVLAKRMESAPHEVILVLDATTGQNGLSQAKLFAETVGVTGIALTKLDGTARGGIVVAIHQILGIPIKWVGLGEGLEDMVEFDSEAFVEGMLG